MSGRWSFSSALECENALAFSTLPSTTPQKTGGRFRPARDLLAAIGLYGVMAFVVTRRTKEIGVRMALGTNPRSVIALVMREVEVLVVIGLALGVPAAIGWTGSYRPSFMALRPVIRGLRESVLSFSSQFQAPPG
ncbi:MAG: FtsX-like permease family protein [Acidobacteriaceae bacterium]|nr:FtsX-like permease family protein [Acidobacteriaceae bacterium]